MRRCAKLVPLERVREREGNCGWVTVVIVVATVVLHQGQEQRIGHITRPILFHRFGIMRTRHDTITRGVRSFHPHRRRSTLIHGHGDVRTEVILHQTGQIFGIQPTGNILRATFVRTISRHTVGVAVGDADGDAVGTAEGDAVGTKIIFPVESAVAFTADPIFLLD